MIQPQSSHIQVSQVQTEKLEQLVDSSTARLFQAKTVFPFRIFPCEVILTRSKISTIDHYFFFTKEVRSMLISSIARVEAEEAAFLAAVILYDISPNGAALRITHLWKSDAQQLRKFIEGLMIANREGVDVNKINDADIAENIETLGTTTETPSTVNNE